MQKIRLFILALASQLLFSVHVHAQEKNNKTFIIKETSSHVDIQLYIQAVEKADFNCYHLSKTRRTLVFDTGIKVELFSISEMLMNDVKINRSCVVDENQLSNNDFPVYHLNEAGIIMERHDEGTLYKKH